MLFTSRGITELGNTLRIKTSARALFAAAGLISLMTALTFGVPAEAAPQPHSGKKTTPIHVYPTVQAARARRAAAPNPSNIIYHGGPVMTGTPRVYLVFWGSQWGTGTAETTLSNDPSHTAPQLIKLFSGIGARVHPTDANSYEKYSNSLGFYCTGVPIGTDGLNAQTGCGKQPAASHVGFPKDGALIGIYNDTATAAPSSATQAQLAAEADRAAAHFGVSGANAQFIIASATGTHPDGFPNGQWCAWHSYSNATATNTAFTNLPYLPDAGANCGANFVNANGPTDGVTIVAGHEYSETMTDPLLNAWYDVQGNENSDKCAWVSGSSNPQANSQNVALGTGTVPLQSNWLNSATFNNLTGSCAISSK